MILATNLTRKMIVIHWIGQLNAGRAGDGGIMASESLVATQSGAQTLTAFPAPSGILVAIMKKRIESRSPHRSFCLFIIISLLFACCNLVSRLRLLVGPNSATSERTARCPSETGTSHHRAIKKIMRYIKCTRCLQCSNSLDCHNRESRKGR